MTFRDLANLSMDLIVAKGTGQIMSPEEAATCLLHANLMLESWNIDRDMVFSSRRDLLTLSVGVQTYTIGAGGDFNIPRPIAINPSNFIHTLTGLRSPIEILNQDQWQDITEQNVSAIQTLKLYDDFNFPLSTLFLYPKPAAASQIELYSWAQLTAFATIDDVISLPPGYSEALVYNLAVAIAPGFVGRIDPNVAAKAIETKAGIKTLNMKPLPGAVMQQKAA